MTNPYTAQTIVDYNTSPPADDASAVASNQLFWSKHKDKLADPIKTLTEAINTELVDTFNQLDLNQIRAITANDTQLAADERKLISATNTITYTLLAAVTAADGFTVTALNNGTGIVTVEADGSELINDALNLALNPNQAVKLRCNGTGWDIISLFEPIFVLKDDSELTISSGSITPTANYHNVDTESDASSDDLTDIVTTNIPDGGTLLLRANHTDRTVVVNHTASGANKIVTVSGSDISLDDAVKSISLQRRGDHWEQIATDAGEGRLIGLQVFTATGTWTPTAGTNNIEVEVRGCGGGGGGADGSSGVAGSGGGGGQGGRSIERILAADLGATEAVTVGAGGTAGNSSGGSGGTGGTVSFGGPVLIQATGGGGGTGGNTRGGAGGGGGVGSLGDLNLTGQGGGAGTTDVDDATSGAGGGEGGGRGLFSFGAPVTGANGQDGGGASGGVATSASGAAGGVGGVGYVIVREYS